jgi:hypothetical protein
MKTYYYQTSDGYVVTYPEKAIYYHGTRISSNLLVCGRGPSVPNDPSTVADQVFKPAELGAAIDLYSIPYEWWLPLGIVDATQDVTPVAEQCLSVNFACDDATRALIARVLVGGGAGLLIGLFLKVFGYI